MDVTVTNDVRSKIGESSSTDNNLKLEILDKAKIYDEKISLGESIHKVLMKTKIRKKNLSLNNTKKNSIFTKDNY